jgi:acetyl/propionyl-CoA carboxylase alpha subunit
LFLVPVECKKQIVQLLYDGIGFAFDLVRIQIASKKEVIIMKRLVNPMVGKIREINVKIGQMITEDGQVFIVKNMRMENISCGDSCTDDVFVKVGGRAEEEKPWMICDGGGFGR